MKRFSCVALMCVLAIALVSQAGAEEKIASGLQPGKLIGAFNVTKLAGAEDDGVKIGKNLCYRCKNGGRPQVMIFTRSTDEKVVSLVKELDEAIAKHSDKQLRSFVNVLGESKNSASEAAMKIAKASKAKNVPFVVPNEVENGPDDYGINPKAEITIIMAEGGKVKATHAASTAKTLDVSAIVKDLSKILEN